MKILKRTFPIIGILVLLLIILVIGSTFYYEYQDSKFYNIEIPIKFQHLQKPIESFTFEQIDSLKNLKPAQDELIIFGNGFGGYNFYFWHKADNKGELYIRGFELTMNVELMQKELPQRTKKIIKVDNNIHFFNARTVIFEGTFNKYYPVRFELWFKSESGELKKLLETEYLIDGWDR